VAGGIVALVALLAFAIVRARRARRREIESAGEPTTPPAKPKRPALRIEEVVPEAEAPPPETPEPAAAEAEAPDHEAAIEPPAHAPSPPTPVAAVKLEATPTRADAQATAAPAVPMPVDKPRRPEARPHLKAHDAAALAPGLARTRAGWVSRLGDVFRANRTIEPALVEEIEKVLLTADIGVRTSQKLLDEIRASLSRRELADPQAVWAFLRRRCIDFLRVTAPAMDFAQAKPFVLLAIGVNGSGKTTTIGKLASKLRAGGQSVLLAAGDTFRAAATEQLEVWGARVGAPVVRGKEGGDPSSVVFEAIKRGRNDGTDVVIADTAGRLHTKANLMDELQKIGRVAGKAMPGAPHETWLVIDATSGQNAIAQAQIFTQAMSITGIVLTKLDGTAKGGVILGITDQLGIPVRYIGIGERVEDLREFDAEEFVEALFEGDQASATLGTSGTD
jgi:fused signal recognition particle receptor